MYKKKLIEVALPLEAINKESAREKSIRHGHPSTLHLWWSRKPLSTCRAVLFASLVDDPSSHPDEFPTEAVQQAERERLFKIIEDLVKWENSNNESVLAAAHQEILKSTNGNPPTVLDPFCGGGSIPLEAQRLGLEAHGSDLNPVAVLITKALIEIPPKFSNRSPVNQTSGTLPVKQWKGAEGLASDVRNYGEWMRGEATKRIGHLYPKIKLSTEQPGAEATVIAWLWIRTVKCSNPACGIQMPLSSKFALSTKKGKQAWVEPELDAKSKRMRFTVRTGAGNIPDGTVNRKGAVCLSCKQPTSLDYVRNEGQNGRLNAQLMAIVAEGQKGRIYQSPTQQQEELALRCTAPWKPDAKLPDNARDIRPQLYGMPTYGDLFTNRQLVALTTFSDLISEVREKVLADAVTAGFQNDGKGLDSGGTGATAYADAVATYLAFAVDKCTDYWSTIATWAQSGEFMRNCFARQAIPMTWDFAECCPFSKSTGNWSSAIDWVTQAISFTPGKGPAIVRQQAAQDLIPSNLPVVISTDPPYYDNIGYADLSDFFYVWLRRSLSTFQPSFFSTMVVPKAEELVATPYRFGGDRNQAQKFFEEGLGCFFEIAAKIQEKHFPISIYYAFKQSESDEGASESDVLETPSNIRASTGWETMLEGLLNAGLSIVGTWPMRSERSSRPVASGTNALASSIVLICRPLSQQAEKISRRNFITSLKEELPTALRQLQHGHIAPVDLAQAAIGPGMAIFSRYADVLEADGKRMPVRTALQLINQVLDEVLLEQDSDYDTDTRWAVSWFEQFGFNEGKFGDAELLSKAKDTGLDGLVASGIVQSKGGKVRLFRSSELAEDWHPDTDKRLTVWEITHYLSRYLEEGGINKAAALMKLLGGKAESGQELAYRLFGICERKKWSEYALPYNNLVVAWPDIKHVASTLEGDPKQLALEV